MMTEYVIVAVYVPQEHSHTVRTAMCDSGAGTVDDGRCDRVTYTSRSVFRYRVLDRVRQKAGPVGEEFEEVQDRIEAICRRDRVETVVRAIVAAHPYETPAISIYPTLTGEYKYWED